MIIQLLFEEPILFLIWMILIVFTISIHEYFHAFTANALGDSTAKYQGRLTLNPLAHLDPIGTLLLLIVGIGWGRPVPFNPLNLRNQKWGPAIIAISGPASNFLAAVAVGLLLRFFEPTNLLLYFFWSLFVWINLVLGIFNLLPIPPLDGSHLLFAILTPFSEGLKTTLYQIGFYLLIFLIFFGSGLIIGLAQFFYIFIIGKPPLFY